LTLLLQLTALWALNDPPLTISKTFVPLPSDAFVGERIMITVFSINGSSSERLYIRLVNDYASDLPFNSDGIEKVELYEDVNDDGTGGALVPNSGSPIESDTAYRFSFTKSSASTANYAVYYTISPTAKYSLTGGTKVVVNAKISSIQEGNKDAVQVNDSGSMVTVKANGLVYVPGSLKSLLPGTSSGVPPDTTFAIMQFTLRAENSSVGIRSLSLGSASNFATSTTNRNLHVSRIILLADNGDGDYSGEAGEITVHDTDYLSYDKNGNTHEAIELPFDQTITLSAYSVSGGGVPNTPVSERIFYVLYKLGSAFPENTSLTCRLLGGSGTLSSGGASSLQVSSANNVTVTCRLADAWLTASNALVNAPTTVVAGQSGIKMIDFTYKVPDTRQRINNVVFEITNGGGTFRQRTDDGVNRLLLYKYPPALSGSGQTPSLAGVGEIINQSQAVFRNQTLEPGPNQYYVVYDIGVLVTGDMSAQAQVTGISVSSNSRTSNSNASFWSPKAPPGPAHVDMWPNRALIGPLRVTDVLGNDLSSIGPGQSFQVLVPIYNFYERVPPANPRQMEVFYNPSSNMNSTRPVFYAGSDFNSTSTERSDISREFSWTLEGLFGTTFNVNVPGIYNVPYVATFNVVASNLKTNDTVYVDAQVLYNVYTENNAYMWPSPDAPPAGYHAYYDQSMIFRSAAAGLGGGSVPVSDLPGYVTLRLNGAGSTENSSLWPDYILPGGIKFTNTDNAFTTPFVNGDKIPEKSSLTISLNTETEAHLDYEFAIYQNGVPLKRGTNWFLDNAVISLPGGNFSAASAGTTGVLRIAPINGPNKNDVLPETTIRYELLVGGTMEIKEILPYPTPYEPDTGSLYVGFENNSMDSGTMTVYIYDVTGREVYREEALPVLLGYNTYAWAGDFSSGGKVGRGVYILRMTFKGSGKRHEVVTRFGVK
jgi:hypothetical protein